ncbi:MAG: HNH endonuclease [bacterium]|nr:HNH endonuclease [bacterium]MDQ3159062.1 HNH endonuclease [bacterium]
MPSKRTWTDEDLKSAVKNSKSYRSVIKKLGLVPAGGNYVQVQYAIKNQELDVSHFTGMGWKKGRIFGPQPRIPTKEILKNGSTFQSHKLKNRLIQEGLKSAKCELCRWCTKSKDGRIPIELDHINGNRNDNRIENLRILCPNCHSLQPTHRGRNKAKNKHVGR